VFVCGLEKAWQFMMLPCPLNVPREENSGGYVICVWLGKQYTQENVGLMLNSRKWVLKRKHDVVIV
jgi:hypothetical protein